VDTVPLDIGIRQDDLQALPASGGLRVFVDQAAQDGFSVGLWCVDAGHGGAGSRSGRLARCRVRWDYFFRRDGTAALRVRAWGTPGCPQAPGVSAFRLDEQALRIGQRPAGHAA
jgi:hypothetical protein